MDIFNKKKVRELEQQLLEKEAQDEKRRWDIAQIIGLREEDTGSWSQMINERWKGVPSWEEIVAKLK